MKNILISLSGNCSTGYNLKDLKFDEIIGVDNGTAHLFDRSLTPSKVLGDLDSITSVLYEKVENMNIDLIQYETNKDKHSLIADSIFGLLSSFNTFSFSISSAFSSTNLTT